MKSKIIFLAAFLVSFSFANPSEVTYHGQLRNAGTVQNGNHVFYFKILTNSAVAWESGCLVTQNVEYGYFNVTLGDSSIMNALPSTLFDSSQDLYLRTYVAALGNTTNLLAPDVKINNQGYSVDSDRLGGINAIKYMRLWTNVVIVAPGGRAGGGDFSSIDAAIIYANAHDSIGDPYTVFILPGTYTEAAITTPDAYVSIVGLSRDGCILNGNVKIQNDNLIENLTIKPALANGIDITGGNPTINNVVINGGNYGIMIGAGAGGATIHNVAAYNGTGAAIFDECGAIIDGLTVTNREAFIIDTTQDARYNNIYHSSPSGNAGTIQVAGGGIINSLKSNQKIDIISCGSVRFRNLDIVTAGTAMQIGQVGSVVEVYDAYLESMYTIVVTINYDGNGKVRFDDVHFKSVEANAIDIQSASSGTITFKDCDILVLGTANGINCAISVDKVYVQCCRIRSLNPCIQKVSITTDLWVYDTTLYTPTANSILCTMGGGGNFPRIADTRLETDTNPSQAGPANWNAFGPSGGVPGNPEDNNGNIVAPASGTPVTP